MNNGYKNRLKDSIFKYIGVFACFIGLILLAILIGNILYDGFNRIDWSFLTSLPSRKAEKAGILTAWSGSLWIIIFTFIIAVPIGISAGVYLEEYNRKNQFTRILEINISKITNLSKILKNLIMINLILILIMGQE